MIKRFVIANGTSRVGFDLNKLNGKGDTFGCNALYRDYMPDYIGCIDSPMFEELVRGDVYKATKMISKHLYEGTLKIYPRARVYVQTFQEALGEDLNYDTGQTMLDYAARKTTGTGAIYMLGFDLSNYLEQNKPTNDPMNNIYKGTDCYAPKEAKARYAGKWAIQMAEVFSKNRHIEFYRVGGTIWPNNWNEHPNVKQITYEEFDEHLINR
tara:strand:+ start:931 stop:1563 length:633 start_codon:yes stop_codon:yes gene_type:complete